MASGKEIGKIILKGMLISGGIAVAATSPYFVSRALPKIIKAAKYELKRRRNIKNFQRSFYYLKSQDMIKIEDRGGQIYISLTAKGKKKAGRYNIDELEIKKPKKWDGKWRLLIFDIPNKHKIKREALRGKIKELGLYQLQKSVWVCPYNFHKEMEILRHFFFLKKDEMKAIIATVIEDDEKIKAFFGV
jgi:CRISPR/Cas system-associated endoribonuclease Cas2